LRQVAPEMRARQDEESRAWLARFEQLGERLSFDLSAAERAEPAVAA